MVCPGDAATVDVDGVGSSWTGWSCAWVLVGSAVDHWDQADPAKDDSDRVLGDLDEASEVSVC